MASAKLLALLHLSVVLLTSFTALAYNEAVSFAQAPHYTHPSHPPVEAPKPGHHHKGGHHHHHPKPPTQPPMKPPTPPIKAPIPPPPAKAPVNPPTKVPTPPPKVPTPPPKAPSPPPKVPTPPPKAPTSPPKVPTPPPKVPTPPPKAPTPPPKYPPMPPMMKLVAIQGVVYCKSCKYTGVDTLTGATALANATVKLVCASGKFHMVHLAKTDKNGYFYLTPPKLTTAGIGICKVLLAKSPSAKCSVPTKLHNGLKGALLVPPPPINKTPSVPSKFALFTVGPFAYEAVKKCYQ